jgi:membrane-associated HD superfamily phosphohydrolase
MNGRIKNSLKFIPFLSFIIYAYFSRNWEFMNRLIGLVFFGVVFCVIIFKQYQREENRQKKTVRVLTLLIFVLASIASWLLSSSLI